MIRRTDMFVACVLTTALGGCSFSAKKAPVSDEVIHEPVAAAALPDEPPAASGYSLTVPGFHFRTNSSELSEASDELMLQAAQFMKANPSSSAVIAGHTDDLGVEKDNFDLATRRAFAVRNALIAEGVDSARITTVSLGETDPLVSNLTPEVQTENRRVEIQFLPQLFPDSSPTVLFPQSSQTLITADSSLADSL